MSRSTEIKQSLLHNHQQVFLQLVVGMGLAGTLTSTVLAQTTITINPQESATPTAADLKPASEPEPQIAPHVEPSTAVAPLPTAEPMDQIPEIPVVPSPAAKMPSSAEIEPSKLPQPTTGSNPYIDPTPYATGATPYTAPSSIVLTDRASGCQIVLREGQPLAGVPCPAPEERAATPQWSPRTVERNNAPVAVTPLGRSEEVATTDFPELAVNYYQRTRRPLAQPGNGNLRLLFPLSIPAPISSLFGWRVHPITGDMRFHSGTDLAAPMGTPVLAAFAGQVAIADFLGGYGLTVVLEHQKSTQQTLYGHLSEIFVRPGEWVEQGTVIGRVGSTGNSTGPHLHFEVRQLTPEGWVAMDPGEQLETALAQFTQSLQVAQGPSTGPAKAVQDKLQPGAGIQVKS